MPELPEVETVCRGLIPDLEGRRIKKLDLRRGDLRFPFPQGLVKTVTGARVKSIRRRAKYILLELDNAMTLIMHLGMSGRLQKAPTDKALGKHDHVIFTTDKNVEIRFTDPRRFGMLDLVLTKDLARHRLLQDIGPEPLLASFNVTYLSKAIATKKVPIKVALLDQKLVAGLGNIYVSEALFYSGIDPRRKASDLKLSEIKQLVPAIKKVLKTAIKWGGSSLRDYVQTNGKLGYFQHHFAVYDRAGKMCPGCICDPVQTGGITAFVQAGRSTYYCARKQK